MREAGEVAGSEPGGCSSGGCCCAGGPEKRFEVGESAPRSWIRAGLATAVGEVPLVKTRLSRGEVLSSWARRWGFRRSGYRVEPGLYGVGNPTPDSVVLVSANYKMSFDYLRRELGGLDAWILVLDTRGVNVWCAAGKGTFGTDELVRRVGAVHLEQVVNHRRLVVPQLGAPGVSAHEVRARCGFQVVYGPVRAGDLPRFLSSGMKAEPAMRRVRFNLADRAAVVPVELVQRARHALVLAAIFLVLGGLARDGFHLERILPVGGIDALLVLGALLAGAVIAPLVLPFVPGRAFSWKGLLVGDLVMIGLWALLHGLGEAPLALASWLLMGGAMSSYVTMNFTGASTYTSLSGVSREMRVAVPLQILSVLAGVTLWVVARFA